MALLPIEVKEGQEPKGTDAWFWGQIGPEDDDDLPLAWLKDFAAGDDAGSEE